MWQRLALGQVESRGTIVLTCILKSSSGKANEFIAWVVVKMKLNLDWIPKQTSPFQTTLVHVPSRELRQLYRTELTRERNVLFNTKLIEPSVNSSPLADDIPCPSLTTVQGVLLDTLIQAEPTFFEGHLQLLGQAIGSAGSPGRSLRLVRHALQIASLFHSYLRTGVNPGNAIDSNINKGWQAQLWSACTEEIHARAKKEAEAKKTNTRGIEVVEVRFAEQLSVDDSNRPKNIVWTTSSNTRMELRHVASQICNALTKRQITDLNSVAVVLPPRQTNEYAVQIASIFNEEFRIPFNLHESLNNTGVGFAKAFALVLEMLSSTFRKADVLHILKHDAFGIIQSGEDEFFLESWTKKLGVVFGLDATDLEQSFIPANERESRYQWMQAIDRLCLVALDVPKASDTLGIPRGSLGLVQRLSHFFLSLRNFRKTNSSANFTLGDWAVEFKKFARALFEEKARLGEAADRKEFDEVLRSLDALARMGCISGNFDIDMAIELVRHPLLRARKRRSGSMYQRGVSVFTLRPGALRVPFTHVFLVGAEDGNVPRIDRVEGTHLFPECALALPDTPHNRDTVALKELVYAHPDRRLFISHVEKNISNGEKKKPSHLLLSLLGIDIKISVAPITRAILDEPTIETKRVPEFGSTSEIAVVDESPELPSLGQKKIPVRALIDACSCPVVARSKYFLKVGENPLPEEMPMYPDAELSFLDSRIVVDQTMRAWMSDPNLSADEIPNIYENVLTEMGKDRAIPTSSRIEFAYKKVAETLLSWFGESANYRPAYAFSFGRELFGGNAVILPELALDNGFLLTGRLPSLIHFDESNSFVTAIVTTASQFKNERGFNLPIEPSSKAIITLCALRCVDPGILNGDAKSLLLQFEKAKQWKIFLLSSFAGSETIIREQTIQAWNPMDSKKMLSLWMDLIHSEKSPSLFPYRALESNLSEMTTLENKIEWPKDMPGKIHDRLGKYPYNGRVLLGNVIQNHPLEQNPDETLRQRYPWIISR